MLSPVKWGQQDTLTGAAIEKGPQGDTGSFLLTMESPKVQPNPSLANAPPHVLSQLCPHPVDSTAPRLSSLLLMGHLV